MKMETIITAMLVIVGIIHLLPITGVAGAERLSVLYGLRFDEPNTLILLRHRAVLFGILGLFFVYAAFKPLYQPLALAAGFTSVVTFIAIAISAGGYNTALKKVVMVDVVALVCLLMAAVLCVIVRQRS